MTEEKKLLTESEKLINMEKTEEKKEAKVDSSEDKSTEKMADKKEKSEKKKGDAKPKVKKYEALAYGRSLHISKKHSMYLGAFIKGKSIDDSILNLQKVIKYKIAVPFKGEIPHRKGNMMSGRYPINASKSFINILKSLKGNALVNGMDLDKTVITVVSPSWAARPMRSGGRKGKRVNLIIKAREISGRKK